jgi:hypothetical protein
MKRLWMGVVALLAACSDVSGGGGLEDEQEFITTVELGFSSAAGAVEPVDASWSDPDLDGTAEVAPAILAEGVDYTLSVRFFDAASNPVEDISVEVAAEGEDHQVFLTGDGVQGPATPDVTAPRLTVAYADADPGGLPLGLLHDVTASAVGSGTLVVTLQHLPPQGGVAVKVAGLAERVATDGLGALPGETDVSVAIPFEVR